VRVGQAGHGQLIPTVAGSVLTFNAGSSSLKFALFAHRGTAIEPLFRGQVEDLDKDPRFLVSDTGGRRIVDQDLGQLRPGAWTHPEALAHLLHWIDAHDDGLVLTAIGHRVVHGGEAFQAPVLLDAAAIDAIEALSALAPLHQPASIAPVRALAALRPDLPQVACFDTAFHGTLDAVERTFALGADLRAHGVRRFGFHGLSYEYIAGELPARLGALAEGRVIVAHLGNGASMCAMHARRSRATTMGFTALDGLMMGTRCGALDPGAVLHLLRHAGIDATTLERKLYRESGLLGVSGLSHDMRTLLASTSPEAALAVDLYCHRIVREVGSLAAAIGGMDALVFTAGIGEHAAPVRARVVEALGWMGMQLDAGANASSHPCITAPGSRVHAFVIPTNEEAVVARHALALSRAPGDYQPEVPGSPLNGPTTSGVTHPA
jgi:acetate kinase